MEHLRCVVERITYQNAENGYTVLRCAAKGSKDLITVVGLMPDVHVGSVLALDGFWKMDAKYGRQFSAERIEETLPATVYGIEKYLGSGLVKGVGPKFAKRIVQKFGKDTLDVIETNPDALSQVEGIGRVRVERIKKSWQEQKEIKNIMLFLQSHEVSTAHATKIFKTYGSDSINIVKDNPYRLADDIWGIGFKTADAIAEKLGIGKARFIRLRSGILYTLNKLAESGHCYALWEQLIAKARELLEVEEPELAMTLDEMMRSQDVIREEEAIYLPPFYYSESGCAKLLLRLLEAEGRRMPNPELLLNQIEKTSEMTYDEVQKEAIRTAMTSKVMILTGGPGTGKTTTTLGIISTLRMTGAQVILAAPTGRAAKRMSEATGMEAKTIHRLLEYKPPDGYQKKEDNPLEGDVLILDECSMIDIMLMYNLLKALPESMGLILVGDTDQLPSVGAGNVLRDMIASGRIPVVRLTRIFRQAQGSRIIMNAHRINHGQAIDIRGGRNSDFFFAEKEGNEDTVETLVKYCVKNLPEYYHADPFQDIQVLTPMQRGIGGAANLNRLLQEAMNPTELFLQRGGVQYRLRDKVMQICNNYDKEVFNGDIGTIIRVDREERELTVNFDGRDVTYDISELDELVLAYATTIHKAQGSEYPIVVMPVTMSHFVMLQRNLLYTGVTRAKKILVMIGEKKAVAYAIRNETTTARNTKLAERLAGTLPVRSTTMASYEAKSGEKSEEERSVSTLSADEVWPAGLAENRTPYEVQQQNSSYQIFTAENRRCDDRNTAVSGNSMEVLFHRLSGSEFRRSFSLKANDRCYTAEKGMNTIRAHAADLIRKRLAPAEPLHDGKQTPMRGHPVFLAQHATATCCRNCLEKWHHIPKGKELTEEEQEYVVDVIMEWIRRQMQR